MKTRLYIWVTSDCNLACPYCSQQNTMKENKGYQMSIDEAYRIVKSCQQRNLHFDTIELTGGEASLWKHIREGVVMFGRIADNVTLATNGNNPDLVKSLGMKTWIVSASQATKEQMAKYEPIKRRLTINKHRHKKMPNSPVINSLPALCATSRDPLTGEPQTCFQYLRGKVYHCCDAAAHCYRLGLSHEEYSCDFEEDFIKRFYHKTYNKEICQYCLANQKVWNQL